MSGPRPFPAPSVSHSLDSSLKEGAGSSCGGFCHSTGYSLNRGVTGDFHRPYEKAGVIRLETATLRHLNCGTEKTFAFFVHLCYNT